MTRTWPRWFKPALIALGALVVAVGGASGAWACFPFPLLTVQPHASGPAGAEVTVEGVDFGDHPVEVRWNALDGPLLARGSGARFSLPVTIPQTDDGVYAIVALARLPDDSVNVQAAAAFQVGVVDESGPAGPPGPSPGGQQGRGPAAGAPLSVAATLGVAVGGLVAAAGVGGLAGAAVSRRRGPPAP